MVRVSMSFGLCIALAAKACDKPKTHWCTKISLALSTGPLTLPLCLAPFDEKGLTKLNGQLEPDRVWHVRLLFACAKMVSEFGGVAEGALETAEVVFEKLNRRGLGTWSTYLKRCIHTN